MKSIPRIGLLSLLLTPAALAADAPKGAKQPDTFPFDPAHPLRSALKDEHALGRNAEHWIYNDFPAAVAEARRTGRPIFVTFRCVPCKACNSFDAEVAKGSEIINKLASEKFVSLRQVEMKGVDLSQFQFDYDLNWAAMFINPDGTVYGRYGTQSAAGPDAYNSIESLKKAMERALALHANYPSNKPELQAKRGPDKPYKTPLDMPGMENKDRLSNTTARNNCVHCHMIHDAEQNQWRHEGSFSMEKLYRYPLPDNVGLHIDHNDGRIIEKVLPNSPAASAGLQPGDAVTHVNGQAIISIADIQWVLHHLPDADASVTFTVDRGGQSLSKTLSLSAGWKKIDISWRGSRWSLRPRPGFWPKDLTDAEARSLHLSLPPGGHAYKIQWLNAQTPEGQAAKKAGFRENDVITQINDQPITMDPAQFHLFVRLHYKVNDNLPLTIVKNGEEKRILLPLVE